MKVLLVDWLGRGGIAQATDAWRRELRGLDHEVLVVSRPGRELATTHALAPRRRSPIMAHVDVIRAAVTAVRCEEPDVVVVQGSLVPAAELPVLRAARSKKARTVVVVHNHAPHSLKSGLPTGLSAWLRGADDVVVHSDFVGRRLPGCPPYTRLPLPAHFHVLDAEGGRALVADSDELVAFHFGVLARAYKNSRAVLDLARAGVPGWRFVFAGAGAPPAEPGIVSSHGFLPAATLRATLLAAHATLLPYRSATQSGTVGLSHALGSVPVASAVGGLPEQIHHGHTGFLVEPCAGLTVWRDALIELADPAVRSRLVAEGRRTAEAEHRDFVAGVDALLSGDRSPVT